MEYHTTQRIAEAVTFIEAHLQEKIVLETVADAVHYSKYHLHRMFTDAVGITVHDYIQRRRLTEAARLLTDSQKSIMDISLCAGYESQQAFTSIFKAMYKQTPLAYRKNGKFYPLQLAFPLLRWPEDSFSLKPEIACAVPADIPGWMEFASLVIDGFPCFEASAHMACLKGYMAHQSALIMRRRETIIGAAAFTYAAGSIDFFAIHPQYRRQGAAGVFLDYISNRVFNGREISITTFREGDRADVGQRAQYKRLGFQESELLTEFGYPTQRLVLRPGKERAPHA